MPEPEKPTVASYCTTFLKPEMRHIYRQVTGLQRYQTFVLTRERKCEEQFPFDDVEILARPRKNFLRRFYLKYIRKLPALYYRGEFQTMARLLERRPPDLMHVYFGHTGVHLLPFLRDWGKPCVVSFHGMDIQSRPNQPGYDDQMRQLLEGLPLVLARSHSLMERLAQLGCPEGKLRLNRTGIPLEHYPETKREVPIDGAWHFVQACRLIAKKGLKTALQAFAQFHRGFPKSRFTIAGEGPLLPELESFVRELNIADAVTFRGFLSQAELAALYQEAHIFVHPSEITSDENQEGVPNSMLEAMATELPVLATVHGGIPEAVGHEVSGLLGPERDVEALVAGMHRMAVEPDLWRAMGEAAAASVREEFSQRRAIERLEGFYDEARERGPGTWSADAATSAPKPAKAFQPPPPAFGPSETGSFVYLFERFPSFVQTFCYREVAEMVAQQMQPLVLSLREAEEARPAEFPAEIPVHVLPDPEQLTAAAKQARSDRSMPRAMNRTLQEWTHKEDRHRVYEAFHLGPILRKAGIRHVHAHFAGMAARTAYWLKRFYGLTYSFTGHANDIFCASEFPVSLSDLLREARFVVTETDYARRWLEERFPEARGKTHRVFNGIALDGFLPREVPLPQPPRILAVGRYVEKKGFSDLIAACGLLRDKGVEFQCTIVGGGPLERELASRINTLGLHDRVELAGPRSQGEVRAMLASATVFVLPCVPEADGGSDNLPTVIMEAMAARVPSVSTILAGVPEMITEGVDGLLVQPRDVPAVAAAIERILGDAPLAARLAEAARATAEQRFAIAETTKELKHLLVSKARVIAPPEARKLDPSLASGGWRGLWQG